MFINLKSHLLYTMVHVYVGLTFILLVKARQGNTADCGSLQFEQDTVTEGGSAKLIYTPDNKSASREWRYMENKLTVLYYNGTTNNRTKYVEAEQGRNFTLTILGVAQSDTGHYIVRCGQAYSNWATLTVTPPPTGVPTTPTMPAFSNAVDIHDCKGCVLAELNKPVKLECFVEGGSDPVELNMFKGGNTIPDVNITSTSRSGVKIYYARYNFIPTTADFSVVFTCSVKNPALSVKLAKSAQIYIRVDPETVAVKVQQAKENEPSEIQCITTKGRPPMKSLIYIENIKENKTEKSNEIKTNHTYSITTTTVKQFTRFDNQQKAMCCSDILNRICTKTKNVNVLFPPKKVRVKEMTKYGQDNGDTEVKLKCSVDESNPKSTVEWKGIKDILRTLEAETFTDHTKTRGWTLSTIWMFNLTKEDNGRSMRCEVKNPKFPALELVQIYRPNITYAPVVIISGQENVVAYLGDDVFLSCNVDSNPPSTMSWHNQTSLIKELYGVKNLDLKLVNISVAHSQTYTCAAHNGIGGIESRNVTLIVKDASEKPVTNPITDQEASSASVAVPVIACAVVLVVVVIAVTVFLYCRKKRQHTSLERKGTYEIKIEDRKPSIPPAGNEPVVNNVASLRNENEVEELPEYACVVPKQKRKAANARSEPVSDVDNVEENPEYACVVPKQKRKAANANSEPVSDVDNVEENPEYACVVPKQKRKAANARSEPVSDVDNVEENPEYACVVPKQKRKAANTNSEPVSDADNESHLKGVNLVYAELDLKPGVTRPLVVKDEPTEYMSIDLNKTGTVTINKDSGPL